MAFKPMFSATVFAALFTMAACHKHDDHNHDPNDTDAPQLDIIQPTQGQLAIGTLPVELTVSDQSLHELKVEVVRDADGAVIVSDKVAVHNQKTHTYAKTFSLSMLDGETALTLKVQVEDHSGNETEKKVRFSGKP